MRRLASRMGNRGFGQLLRDTGGDAGTAVADPAQDAAKLAGEQPSTDVDYATWLLAAADAGFADLWKDTRATLEAFSAGNPSHGINPSATDVKVRALVTMFELVRGAIRRWAGAPGSAKRAVTLGSFLRDKTGPHAGAAIDLPRGMGPGTVDEVIAMLERPVPGPIRNRPAVLRRLLRPARRARGQAEGGPGLGRRRRCTGRRRGRHQARRRPHLQGRVGRRPERLEQAGHRPGRVGVHAAKEHRPQGSPPEDAPRGLDARDLPRPPEPRPHRPALTRWLLRPRRPRAGGLRDG